MTVSPTKRQLTVKLVTLRFFAGMLLSGKRRTDATVFRKGTTPVIPHDRPGRWSYLPHYQRSAIRILGVVTVSGGVYAYFFYPIVLIVILTVILVLCLASLGMWWYERRQATVSVRMPYRVKYKDLIRLMEDNNGASTPIVGLAVGRVPVKLDLDNDAPHVALSMGVGAGKSSTMRGLIAQLLRGGVEHITIIDPKYISLAEWKGHPRVTICTTYPDQWEAITAEYNTMVSRYQQLEIDDSLTFPRRVLLIEEGNSWAALMKMYWTDVLSGKGMPPVIRWLAFILFQGRQANMNVLGSWQRLDVASIGSGAARDQFGTRILARFSVQAWKSIVGTVPIPGSPRHKGRAIAVTGEEQVPIQLAFWTPAQARAYADEVTWPTDESQGVQRADQGILPVADPSVTVVPAIDEPALIGDDDMTAETPAAVEIPVIDVTLAEAVETGLTGLTLNGMRTARGRDKRFPKPSGKRGKEFVYRNTDIIAYEATRIAGTR